jgi:hypothetical protein|tara:strand:+ start:2836 stop:2949 length:114 start_codon:yes stop_codon:yes gene_type:complete
MSETDTQHQQGKKTDCALEQGGTDQVVQSGKSQRDEI